MKWCEIFKTGVHKDSNGNERLWTSDDLKKIKENFYNKNKEVPICCGHPKSSSPAYGWVEDLKLAGESLYAAYKDVVPEFKEAVKKGLFKTRSISLSPDLTLRHVAFLGGQTPAVKGLEQFCFSDDKEETIVINFQEAVLRSPTECKKSIDFGNEVAGAVPKAKIQETKNIGENTQMTDELLRLELEEKNKKIQELEAKIEKQEKEQKTKEFQEFADSAIENGYILPVQKNFVIDLLHSLSNETINFADSGEKNAAEVFKDFIKNLKQMDFEEIADRKKIKETISIDFSDTNAIKEGIIETQKEYANKGISLTTIEALNKIKEDK